MSTRLIALLCVVCIACTPDKQLPEKSPVASHTPADTSPFVFRIIGDFNGDKQQDTLTEHIVHVETGNEFYRTDFLRLYDTLAQMVLHGHVLTYVASSSSQIDTIHIPQAIGVAFLHNEGDLDNDGSDEISYVAQWPDISSTNQYHILRHKNGRWRTIYTFPMWEWQLPATPDASPSYGYFGTTGQQKMPRTYTDTLLAIIDTFSLIKKLQSNLLQITTRSEQDYGDSIAISEMMQGIVELKGDTGRMVQVMVNRTIED